MSSTINQAQLNKAETIINIGLKKAAESLSFFMRFEVILNKETIEIIDINNNTIDQNNNEVQKVLITELIGELKGSSYLVFSQDEANLLYKQSLSTDIIENPEKLAIMGEAILLEVDNIITASVITQFSNILGIKCYGGVPTLKELTGKELISHISNNSESAAYILNVKAKFSSNQLNFSPEFLWVLDTKFIDAIDKLSDNKVKELETLKA